MFNQIVPFTDKIYQEDFLNVVFFKRSTKKAIKSYFLERYIWNLLSAKIRKKIMLKQIVSNIDNIY